MLLAACGAAATPAAPKPPAAPPKAVPTTWDQLHGPIKSVAVRPDNPAVAKAFAGEVGKPIDRNHLREQLDRAMREDGVAELALEGRQLADGVELVIAVTPQPIVRAATGKDDKGGVVSLVGAFSLQPNWHLDPDALDHAANTLTELFRDQGYYFATASWTTQPADKGQVDVTFQLAQGPLVTVGSIEIAGNKVGKKDDLVALVKKSVAVGDPWRDDHVERALLEVTAYYYDRGFVNVMVDPPKPPPPAGGAVPIALAIREGDRYTLGALKFTGVDAAQAKSFAALAKLKKGGVFNRREIVDAIARIKDAVKATGKPEPDIEPQTDVDTKKHTIDLTLDVKSH